MSLPALYEIANQFQGLAALADSEELPAEVIRDTLEGLQGDLTTKSVNVAKFILGLEAEARAIDEAIEKLKERAERRRRRAEGIRAYVLFNLQRAGVTKVECPEFTISVRLNPLGVEVEDPSAIPPRFMVQPEPPPARPDKTAIKEALKAGEHVAGCFLRQGERLDIRV